MSRVRPWIPLVVWATLISLFSTDKFSSQNTSRVIVPLLRWLLPHASAHAIELLHHVIRKGAHVFEYFVFGSLLFHAMSGYTRRWTLRWAVTAIAVSAVFAGFDEFHQSFVPNRGASVWDSLLDTSAAAAAVIVAWLLSRRRGGRGMEAEGEPEPRDIVVTPR